MEHQAVPKHVCVLVLDEVTTVVSYVHVFYERLHCENVKR